MLFIKTLLVFLKLNFYKLLIFRKYKSAKDIDRLLFEYILCRFSLIKKNILYVGVHERSYVYQLCLPFSFIDISDRYLLPKPSENIYCNDLIDHQENYDLVILSGILNYGSPKSKFVSILKKENFKTFIIHDWKKNISEHDWIRKDANVNFLPNTFWYAYTRE
jgi:hypothetical protein